MRIAVMGASGSLGGMTINHLLERVAPGDVVAVARTPSKLSALAERGVEVRRGDYTDRASLEAAYAGVDVVHLIPGTALPPERVTHLQNAVEAAKAAGVRHIVHVGLIGTQLDNPFVIMPYMVYAESTIRISGLDFTLLRNSYYADPIADWVPDIVTMGTIPYPTGDGGHPYAAKDDLAAAAAAVLVDAGKHVGEVYDLTGPEALTTDDLCKRVAWVTGEDVRGTDASIEDYLRACADGGEPPAFARLLATLYAPVRLGMTHFATDHVERLTGRAPRSFEVFLRERLA